MPRFLLFSIFLCASSWSEHHNPLSPKSPQSEASVEHAAQNLSFDQVSQEIEFVPKGERESHNLRLGTTRKCYVSGKDGNVTVQDSDVRVLGTGGLFCCFELSEQSRRLAENDPSKLTEPLIELRSLKLRAPQNAGVLESIAQSNIKDTAQYLEVASSDPASFQVRYDKVYCANVANGGSSRTPTYRPPLLEDLTELWKGSLEIRTAYP